jgi:ABC-type methionine transport system ATPase subunit
VKKAERQGMVADILDRFNIVGKKDLYPNQLSGGQQQLVAIARAVVAGDERRLRPSHHQAEGRMGRR